MGTKSLRLLLEKNLIVERRSFVQTLIEILTIVTIFCILLLQMKPHATSKKPRFHKDIVLNDLSQFRKLTFIKESSIPYKLYFTPNNNYTQNLFRITAEKLKLLEAVGFESENDMVDNFDASSTFAGVVLQGLDVILRFPNYFRTRQDKNFFKLQDFWLTRCTELLADHDENDVDFYIREGFLQLLYTIVTTQMKVENIQLPNGYEIPMQISSMLHSSEPKLGCVNDLAEKSIAPGRFLKGSLYYFIYFVPFINLIWKLSREHEENIFAHHWIYSFSYNVQSFAHLVISLLHFILLDTVVFVSIMFLWPSIPVWKSPVLLAFLIVYNMLLILYAMTLSSFIKNAKTAVWCGVTLWITSYAVFLETVNTRTFEILKPKTLIISLVFFNNLLPNGLMDYFEGDESKSFKEIVLFLGVQFLVLLFYGCIFKYVECMRPGRYIKKFRNTKTHQVCKKNCMELRCNLYENNIEYGPLDGEVLQLKNVYSYCDHFKKKPQLRNISMRIFINEISIILGPHNSGKTKFICTLAGWQAYKGYIAFQGQDISAKWSYYRHHVDVSMINNALFDQLTMQETLKYFIFLKQTEGTTQIVSEHEKWLNIMKPLANSRKLVKNLSFDEKRILALCCTMVCNTSVVLLDEPTIHMRSEEQSKYWNILKQEKQNRAIIVTTFSVDEANEIGDRIGILNDGCLTAWGTSYFLRNKFLGQFYLVCFLQPMESIKPINQLLQTHITNVKIHNQFTDRVIYMIPADKKPIFQRLLIDLEKNSSKLGITNIYMAGSSLNEVFMTLTMKSERKNNLPDIEKTLKFINDNKSRFERSFVQALLYKKLLFQSKYFLPICIIFIAFCLMLVFSQIVPAFLSVDRIMFSGQKVFKDSEHTLVEISNIDDIDNGLFYYKNVEYLKESYENRSRKDYNSLAALEVKRSSMAVWFNERIFHSAPLALNLAFNYLTNASTYINKPIILRKGYDIHIIMGTIMPLTLSTIFVNLQDERFSSMLTLQKIARLNDKTKWSVTFLWDISICFAISILYLVMLIACVLDKASWLTAMASLILFFLSGTATLLFVYLMSLFIIEDNKIRAFIKIFFIQLSLGLVPYVLYMNILQENFKILFYIFMTFPGFSVLHGTTKIFDNNEKTNLSSYFQWNNPGILDSIFFLSLISLVYFMMFIAVVICRSVHLKSTPKKIKYLASVCYPYDDERVVKEKVRISNMNIEACRAQTILVDQLESELPKKGNRVNSISFVLNKHACLGIYGSNHSGKSHLLKQLVGERGHWFGEVYIAGYSLKIQMANALKHVGYCPQSKGFNSLLTPAELLKFFLMMNGINKLKHLDYIQDISVSLQLRHYMNYRICDLPENIKRRINVAVALIVRKKILIFDEPTRGLPAFDRILIWNIIKYCRSLGNTIIFATSESLELKELADFVVTVNDGEMLSYDNPHKMEYQYNDGFYLEIKLYSDGLTLGEVEENLNNDVENLNRFVTFFHEESELLYRCDNVCKYYIPVTNVVYSYIFGSMEKNRNRLNIADYTLAPFSLNRVLKLLQKSRREKTRHERARTSLLKDPKTLPRRENI